MNKPPRRPRDDDDDDDIDERPRSRRRASAPPPQQSSSALPWIIGGVIGGGLLLCCLPVGLIGFFFASRVDRVVQKGAEFPVNAVVEDLGPLKKDVFVPAGVRFQVSDKPADLREFVLADEAPLAGYLFWDRQGKVSKFFDCWDWKQGKRVARIEMSDDSIRMSLSPKGTRLLMQRFTQPMDLTLWSLPDGQHKFGRWNPYDGRPKQKFEFRAPELGYAEFLDEDNLLTFSQSGSFDLWDLNKKQSIYSKPAPGNQFVGVSVTGAHVAQQIALSQDRKILAVDNREGFSFYEPRTGNALGKTASLAPKTMGNVWSVQFNRAGTLLASRHNLHTKGVAAMQEFLTVWDAPSGVQKWQYPIDKSLNLTGPITFVGANYVILWDGNIFKGLVVNLTDGRFHRLIEKASIGTRFTHQSPDGRLWCLGSDQILGPLHIAATDFPEKDLAERPGGQDDPKQAPKWLLGPMGISRP